MSIIAAGTTTTTALSSTGNTDGTIQLQVNGTTPSVTLNALGAVGVGAVPNFGTSGQALVSAGSTAAPTWTTIAASQWTTSGSNISYTAGQVQIGTGSAAAPALSVASDTNTGIFFPAADTIAFAEGGAEVARFDASGNLLLGTTSGSERLVVTGATGDIARITDNTNAPLLFGTNANGPYVFTPSSAALRFGTFNTERARITSTGAWSFGSSGTATGTSGQVLTSAGSGAAPTWATPAGGSWVFLSSVTATGATQVVDIETTIDSTYDTYAIIYTNVYHNTASDYALAVRVRAGGSYSTASQYRFHLSRSSSTSGTYVGQAGPTNTSFVITGSQAGEFGNNPARAAGILYFSNPSSTNAYKNFWGDGVAVDVSDTATQAKFSGSFTIAGQAVTGIRFLFATSVFVYGTFRLYGIKNS